MKKRSTRDRILARVAELGHWPTYKELAHEIGCSPLTVKAARQWSEERAEDQRLKSLEHPCIYCQKQEQVSLEGCDQCSKFLMDCFALGQMTLFLRNNVGYQPKRFELNRAKIACATIISEWVTLRAEIEVWGDQMGYRSHNQWFYEGADAQAFGMGTEEFKEPDEEDER